MIRKLLNSLFSMTIMIFISCLSIYIHTLANNSIHTNFNKENNAWINEDNNLDKEVPSDPAIKKAIIILLAFSIPCSILICLCVCRCSRESILHYLNNLRNWLFRRNQNEPVVFYGYRVSPSEQQIPNPLQMPLGEDVL